MGFLSSLFGGGKGGGKGRKVANVAKRFDIRGKSGQGSMSKVFQAYDRELGRTICLKILNKEKTKKFEERFAGIATIMPRLAAKRCRSPSHALDLAWAFMVPADISEPPPD